MTAERIPLGYPKNKIHVQIQVMYVLHERSVQHYGADMRILESTPLIKRERVAVKTIAEVLRKNFPVEEIILFGSKSRGDDEKHSDIDLLIVTDQTLHWKDEKAIVEIMFDAGMEYDVIFSPLFVSSEEWNKGIFTEFPVYKEIIRDGALVQ